MNTLLRSFLLLSILLSLSIIGSGCVASEAGIPNAVVLVHADGKTEKLTLPPGSTVSEAIDTLGIELGTHDKTTPPGYTLLSTGMEILVTRVTEYYESQTQVVPYERQIVKNASISEGEIRLIQAGKNGLEELTYRVIEEEGLEQRKVIVRRNVVLDPVPEIMMIGTQRGYVPLTFPGKIAFVSAQNAWLIDGETGSRRPIMATGDLDGRILEFSPDGKWLLFTRQLEDIGDGINRMWLIDVQNPDTELIDLEVENVIHFAQWSPNSPSSAQTYTIAYSTVEPRPSAPGWQSNNDLQILRISEEGTVYEDDTIIETNSGGQYGWWGTNYVWSPDGSKVAYSRADSIGLVDFEENRLEPLVNIVPYQTLSDWAWVPPIAWGPFSETLYYIEHGLPAAFEIPEASQSFNVMALSSENSTIGPLVRNSGMFSHMATSPTTGELTAFSLALLQTIQPLESETGDYRLAVMDQDGSNLRILFPPEGELGLEPGPIEWSPDGSRIALLYKNDLWVIDPENLTTQPVTADGLTSAFDWSER